MLIINYKRLCTVSFIFSLLFSFNVFADTSEAIISEEPFFDNSVQIIMDNGTIIDSPLQESEMYVISDVGAKENYDSETALFVLDYGASVSVVDDFNGISKIKVDDSYYYINSDCIGTKQDLDEMTDLIKSREYPSAYYIWNYLISNGYSEAVAAGIIGNMMTEVGGWIGNAATLNLDVCNNGRTYYGLCQWNKKLYSGVVGNNLHEQCEFLTSTIEKEFNEFGYKSGHSFSSFLEINNPAEAALAFAKTYERCGKSSYKRRQNSAVIAYDYFSYV